MLYFNFMCVFIFCQSATASLERRLKAMHYEKAQRPFHGNSPVNVTVQVHIYMVGPIDEKHFTFESGFYLRQWWEDPRLKNNDSSTFHGTSLDHLLWIPDTSVYDADTLTKFNDAIRTVIEPTGVVYTSRRLSTKTHCNLDLNFYPMDTQTCKLILESYAFTTNEVNISWHDVPLIRSADLTLEGFDLRKMSTKTRRTEVLVGNKTHHFKFLDVQFTVKRTFMYHIYRTYIPSLLLIIFTFGTFWVPDTAVPARMGMIVTSFLANVFILQAVSEETVKVSYTTPMQMFLVVNITLIVLTMVEYLLILQLNINKTDKPQVDYSSNLAFNQDEQQTGFQTYQSVQKTEIRPAERNVFRRYDVHIVDKTSRILFPLTYIIICAVHFGYYSTAS